MVRTKKKIIIIIHMRARMCPGGGLGSYFIYISVETSRKIEEQFPCISGERVSLAEAGMKNKILCNRH